ncbi:cell wall-binding repeat-containing protein [Mobiluncus mulieris]|uniref:Cell wall-binding repeat-containing protein n=1 Tax=Mobiluncus mulieris TaxID=2052 RepID=A0A7Y0U2B7_9ACTO|nr:cell wall-binding repeat-containing protein [Mobiluncus mulieris]NMW65618.1 cell wall-binding repeat-containing protein [Mobiluncus mulieris]
MMNFGKKMAVGVASAALIAGMGVVPAFAAGSEAPKPLDGGWDRIASGKPANDRIDTAIEVASAAYANKALAQAVYLVNSEAMVDAATAGQLADGPIFLVNNNSRVIDQVKGEVAKYTSAKTVYAIGGTGVISDNTLKAVADGKATARLSGADRYATAAEVAKRVIAVTPELAKNVYVARGDNPIDALTAGTLDNGPVIYAKGGELPAASKAYVESAKPEKVVGLGGKGAVPDSALTTAQVSGSPIKVNPAEKNDESKAAWKQFNEARWLYLGYNAYKDKLSVEAIGTVGVSTNPKDTPIEHPEWLGDKTDVWSFSYGQPNARFQGYKKQLSELAKRKSDVVDSYINTLKADAQQDINNLASANGGKITWAALKADITGGNVKALVKAAKEIYGVDLNSNDNQADFYVMVPDKDAPRDKDKAAVTGVAWGKLADDSDYKKAADKAGDVVKEFRKDPSKPEVLDKNADTRIASHRNVTTKELSGFVTSDQVRLGVVQSVLGKFVSIAQSNADTTRGQMLSALEKLRGGKEFFRLAGKDRYETAVAISQYRRAVFGGLNRNDISEGGNLNKVYLANGVTMVDALVAGVLTRGPILLTDKEGNLPEATLKELKAIGASETTVKGKMPFVMLVGGKSAVPDKTGIKAAATIKEGNDTKPEEKKNTNANKSLKAASVSAYPGQDVDVAMHVAGDKNAPTLSLVDITMSDKKTSIKGTGDAKIEGVANENKSRFAKTGTMHFTVGKDVAPGTYYAAVKDANGHEGTVTISVANKFEVTIAKDRIQAADPDLTGGGVNVTGMYNGQSATGHFTCSTDSLALTYNAGVVKAVAGGLAALSDGAKIDFTCTHNSGVKAGFSVTIYKNAATAPAFDVNAAAAPVAGELYIVKADGSVGSDHPVNLKVNTLSGHPFALKLKNPDAKATFTATQKFKGNVTDAWVKKQGDDVYVLFTVPGSAAANDTVTVSVTASEAGKAPTKIATDAVITVAAN